MNTMNTRNKKILKSFWTCECKGAKYAFRKNHISKFDSKTFSLSVLNFDNKYDKFKIDFLNSTVMKMNPEEFIPLLENHCFDVDYTTQKEDEEGIEDILLGIYDDESSIDSQQNLNDFKTLFNIMKLDGIQFKSNIKNEGRFFTVQADDQTICELKVYPLMYRDDDKDKFEIICYSKEKRDTEKLDYIRRQDPGKNLVGRAKFEFGIIPCSLDLSNDRLKGCLTFDKKLSVPASKLRLMSDLNDYQIRRNINNCFNLVELSNEMAKNVNLIGYYTKFIQDKENEWRSLFSETYKQILSKFSYFDKVSQILEIIGFAALLISETVIQVIQTVYLVGKNHPDNEYDPEKFFIFYFVFDLKAGTIIGDVYFKRKIGEEHTWKNKITSKYAEGFYYFHQFEGEKQELIKVKIDLDENQSDDDYFLEFYRDSQNLKELIIKNKDQDFKAKEVTFEMFYSKYLFTTEINREKLKASIKFVDKNKLLILFHEGKGCKYEFSEFYDLSNKEEVVSFNGWDHYEIIKPIYTAYRYDEACFKQVFSELLNLAQEIDQDKTRLRLEGEWIKDNNPMRKKHKELKDVEDRFYKLIRLLVALREYSYEFVQSLDLKRYFKACKINYGKLEKYNED